MRSVCCTAGPSTASPNGRPPDAGAPEVRGRLREMAFGPGVDRPELRPGLRGASRHLACPPSGRHLEPPAARYPHRPASRTHPRADRPRTPAHATQPLVTVTSPTQGGTHDQP